MSAHGVVELFFFIAFACFILFLIFLLNSQAPAQTRNPEIRDSIAGLSSTDAPNLEMLFADRDYRTLCARPELKIVSAKYRRDRRRIALLWLGELQRDVRLVWEFRRFLVRNGLPVTFREEAGIAFAGSFALIYLHVTRLTVFFCGPFVLSGALRHAGSPVSRLSSRGAGLLARAPADARVRLEQKWAQHVLSWSAS